MMSEVETAVAGAAGDAGVVGANGVAGVAGAWTGVDGVAPGCMGSVVPGVVDFCAVASPAVASTMTAAPRRSARLIQ
jgi:hypothetical protein